VQKRKEAVPKGTASLRTRSDWTEHALIGLRDANGYIGKHYIRVYAQRYPALDHCRVPFSPL